MQTEADQQELSLSGDPEPDMATAKGRLTQLLEDLTREGRTQAADDLKQLIRSSEVATKISASATLRRECLVASLQCRVMEMPCPTEENYDWWIGELVECVLKQDARMRSRDPHVKREG
ncbi:hypothetical protein [Thalassospira lucentensis]|uniref:hypothetical protein n=1 Tax=Thalassospira lucentensis TaxID=168935 RepID=UPI0029435895|nr:hypothetical protein [Thalassospira lucentensis]WOI09003.1 hypothetical protein R1T41_00820 [Thalassospira lucentensis]